MAGAASAALPTGFGTGLTAISGDLSDLIDLVIPWVVTICAALLGVVGINYIWKLVKSKLGR